MKIVLVNREWSPVTSGAFLFILLLGAGCIGPRQMSQVSIPEGFSRGGGGVVQTLSGPAAKEIVHRDSGIRLRHIPSGTFQMGSNPEEVGHTEAENLRQVEIRKDFYIGVYEVKQREWQKIMGENPSFLTKNSGDYPVELVSWDACVAFCRELGEGFRLPTEAEWEYACRAGSSSRFSHGDSAKKIHQYGNTAGKEATGVDMPAFSFSPAFFDEKARNDGYDGTSPGGSYRPNPWGLYDMHGNVAEWCSDRADVYGPYSEDDLVDPKGSADGINRVLRGGSCRSLPAHVRSAFRGMGNPKSRAPTVGLRVVYSPTEAQLGDEVTE